MTAPLTNFDFMDYYRDNKNFGGVYSRDNIPRLQTSIYIVNMDNQEGSGTHWVVIFNMHQEACIYFDSFGVEPPEEALNRMRQTNKKMICNTYRIQDLNSNKCGFFCIYVIDELLKGRGFIDILTDFDPLNYKKNDGFISALL